MEKNLPKVFASPIDKKITNNREFYVSSSKPNIVKDAENIPLKINQIFGSPHHVYKSKVRIIINNEEIETTIVGKTNNYLLTLNGEKINIDSIESIERI